MSIQDQVDAIRGQFAPQWAVHDVLAPTDSQDRSTEIPEGPFMIWADQDCYVKLGGSSVAATADLSDSVYVQQYERIMFYSGAAGGQYLSAIRDSTNGNVQILTANPQ